MELHADLCKLSVCVRVGFIRSLALYILCSELFLSILYGEL